MTAYELFTGAEKLRQAQEILYLIPSLLSSPFFFLREFFSMILHLPSCRRFWAGHLVCAEKNTILSGFSLESWYLLVL